MARSFDELQDAIIRPDVGGEGDWLARELARVSAGTIIDQFYARARVIASALRKGGAGEIELVIVEPVTAKAISPDSFIPHDIVDPRAVP